MESLLLFLAIGAMFAGGDAQGQSFSYSCSTVNGKKVCESQQGQGNAAASSAQSSNGFGQPDYQNAQAAIGQTGTNQFQSSQTTVGSPPSGNGGGGSNFAFSSSGTGFGGGGFGFVPFFGFPPGNPPANPGPGQQNPGAGQPAGNPPPNFPFFGFPFAGAGGGAVAGGGGAFAGGFAGGFPFGPFGR